MASISLAFSPIPAQVRTARLLGVAYARRCGLPDEVVDEVRLAVGEACSRAVAIHATLGSNEPVRVRFADNGQGFQIEIDDPGAADRVVSADLDLVGRAVHDEQPAGAQSPDGGALGALPAGMDLALIAGLVDEFDIAARAGGGTTVQLRWKP